MKKVAEQQQQPSTSVVLDQKKIAELQVIGPKMMAQAKDIEISNNDDFLASGSLLDLVVKRQKDWTEFFKKPADDANNIHKFITGLRTAILKPLQDAEALIKSRRADFRRKVDMEDRAREEEERRKAKEAADNRAIDEAAQLKAIGEHEAADIIINRAATAPPPPVSMQSSIPKEKGKSIQKTWRFEIRNESLIKREFMTPDLSSIAATVKKLGPDAMSIIGGIEVFAEEREIVRTK